MTSGDTASAVYPELIANSHGRAWLNCLAYLEAHCNPHAPAPYPSSTVLYSQLLWVLAEALGVRNVLEIGIGPDACSGVIFASSMGTRGGGVLRSIDIDESRPKPEYRQLAVENHVDWIVSHGDSLTLVNALPADLQVDLLYIDGDHEYAHAYGDTVGYWPYLRPGGYLVIDDFPGCDGVIQAKKQLEDEGLMFVHLSHHPPHANGRLLCQKAGASR